MFSVRLVSADSYQAQPLPQLDPAFSEFRGSEIKHVPIIRVFGSLPTGEKTCLHIHGVFPYLYVPYTGEEDPASLAYRLAASLDTAINVSLGSATSGTQHVYLIQRVSGIPFYGYHKKEHQYLKIYFYNPSMIKRAADLLQNGSVLSRSLQPHEAHIPYVLQFMMDYNVYGMSMINLRIAKHRRITQSLAEIGSSGLSGISENSEVDYLPSSVERQSTCELEMDALASDILNRREIERGLDLNPGLAAIWEEERARRAQAGLQGGDSQLVNPKSPPRPTFQPTENDLYQEQRLARRLLMISQCDESTLSTPLSRSVAYAAEVRDGENLMNSSNISIPSIQRSQPVPRDDTVEDASLLDSPTIVDSPKLSADCSVLGSDDQPLVDLLVELAGGGVSENPESVDTDSVLGSQVSLLASEPRSDNEDEDIPDLNLTSLQLDSLSDTANVRDPREDSSRDKSSSSTFHLSPFLTSREAVSGASRSADDEDPEIIPKASRTHRMPQYDGAGDVSPTLGNSSSSSEDENDSANPKNAKEFSHLPKYNGACEVAPQSRKSETREQTTKSSCRPSNALLPTAQWDSPPCESDRSGDRVRNASDRSPVDGAPETEASRLSTSPSSALTSDAYLGQYTAINYEPFDRLLEIGPDFVPDLEGMHSSMEIGILLSSGDSDSPESVIQESDKDTIPLDAVLNGDPCFTESAELDKSDVTELRDQYASLLGNSLLPDVHTNPRIDDDLGSASNFSDSDYQGNEKNCNFSLNAPSPCSAAASRDSSSSSENVAPNIQEPEVRGGAKIKLGPTNEDCKEPRAPSDNSDYNCNFVATWAELQNIREDKRLYRLRNRMTGQWIPGPRRSRRKADRRSLPNITTQLFGRVPESMQFQLAAENRHRSPRKVPLSTAGKTPVRRAKNATPPPYIPLENPVVTKKIVEVVEEKLSTSPLPGVARLPELEREETSEESACQPLHTEASLAAFHRSIIGSDNPLAESKKSPENLYSAETFVESLVEPALPVFEELSEDLAIELPDRETKILLGNSHYSSGRSARSFGGLEHRHCTWSVRQRRIIQDQVFTSDQLYVIEKRKRGKQLPPDRSPCTKCCKLPFVPLRKLDLGTEAKIADCLEARTKTEESSRDLPYRPSSNSAESPGAEQKVSSVALNNRIVKASLADRLPKRRSRGRRRRAETEPNLNDTSMTRSSSDDEPMSFESSDWAETEGRRSVRRMASDDEARDPYNMRTTKKPPISRRKKPRARVSEIATPRTCRDLPGIPGIIDYPKKRGRQKKHRDETRVEAPKPKPLRSVLFPNWGAEREISESPNGAPKTIPNGLVESRGASLSDRRKGRSLKTALPISPSPKSHARLEDQSNQSDRKISTSVKQTPENEALNSMIREVKCPRTRAKLKMLIKSRRRSKLGGFRSERKLSASGEERASEAKVATPVVPNNSSRSAIPRIDPPRERAEECGRISLEKIVAEPEEKCHPANAPEEAKVDENCVSREAPTEFAARAEDRVDALDFETPALSVVFDASGDIFDTETEIVQGVSKGRNCEESPNDTRQLSFRSDKYAISVTNFFTASNYTIDAVSLEIPTCLFEEDSNSVEQRLRIVQEGSQSSLDASSCLDPRDLDVYDAESLTPSSSLSQLATESSLDSSELSASSVLDDSTKSESRYSRSGKTREGQGTACKDTDDDLSELDSPEFEALSPSPKICEILGNSLEGQFEADQSSKAEHFGEELARDESRRQGSVAEDAKLDEEIENLVSQRVVRLEDEPEIAADCKARRFASGETKCGAGECDSFFEEKEITSRWRGKHREDSAGTTNEATVGRDFSKGVSSGGRGSEESRRSENGWKGFAETRMEEGELSMNILKENGSLSHERERQESRMSENDRETLPENRKEKKTLSMIIPKENGISSHEREKEESRMSESDREALPETREEKKTLLMNIPKENGISSHEREKEESRMSESDREALPETRKEKKTLSMNIPKENGISSHEREKEESRMSESDWEALPETREEEKTLSMNIPKENGISSHEREKEESRMSESDREALPETLKEKKTLSMNIPKKNGISSHEREKQESRMNDNDRETLPETRKEEKTLPMNIPKENGISSHEREKQESRMIDYDREALPETLKEQKTLSMNIPKENGISSHEREKEESRVNKNDKKKFPRRVTEVEYVSIGEEEDAGITHSDEKKAAEPRRISNSESEVALVSEKDEAVDAAIENEKKSIESGLMTSSKIVESIIASKKALDDEEPETVDREKKEPTVARKNVELLIARGESEQLIKEKFERVDAAIESEKKLPIDSQAEELRQLITSRKIVESIIADKEKVLEAVIESETKSVDVDENSRPSIATIETPEPFAFEDYAKSPSITTSKNCEELFVITVNEVELARIGVKQLATIDPEEKAPIAAEKNSELLSTKNETELQFINEKYEKLDRENKPIESEENSREPLIAIREKARPVTSEEKAPIAAEKNSELLSTKNETELQFINEKYEKLDRENKPIESEENSREPLIATRGKARPVTSEEKEPIAAEKNSELLSTKNETELQFINEKYEKVDRENKPIESEENSREPLIATREKARPVTSEDDSPSTAVGEAPEPIFGNVGEFLETVSSKEPEESHRISTDAIVETVKKYASEAPKESGEFESNDESDGISKSNGLDGEIGKVSQVDRNMNDAETEQRESRLSSLSGEVPRVETRKEAFKCRPVTIKLVSLDLSRFSSFALKSRPKSRLGEAEALEPSNERAATLAKIPEVNAERRICRSARMKKRAGRSQPTRKCAGKIKLERKLSEEKIRREYRSEYFRERISEHSGQKISDDSEESSLESSSREVEGKYGKTGKGETLSTSRAQEKIQEKSALNGEENSDPEETVWGIETSTSENSGDETTSEYEPSEKSSEISSERSSGESNSFNDFGGGITGERSDESFPGKTADEKDVSYARCVKAKRKLNGRFSKKLLSGSRAINVGTKKIAREVSETCREFVLTNRENPAKSSSQSARENANAGTTGRSARNRETEHTNAGQKVEEKNTELISSKSRGLERFGKRSGEDVEILDSEYEKSREKCAQDIDEKLSEKKCAEEVDEKISGKNRAEEVDEKMSGKECAEAVDEKISGKKCAGEVDEKMSGKKCAGEDAEKIAAKKYAKGIDEKLSEELNSRAQENLKKIEPKSTRSRGNKISEGAQKPLWEESIEDITGNAERIAVGRVRSVKKSAEENVEFIAERKSSQERKNVVKENIEPKSPRVRVGKNREEINIKTGEAISRESDYSSLQSENDIEPISAKPRRRGRSGKSSKANRQDLIEKSQSPNEERNSSSQTLVDEPVEKKNPIRAEKKIRSCKTPLTNARFRFPEKPSVQENTSKPIAEETSDSEPSSQESLLEGLDDPTEKKISIRAEKKVRSCKTPLTSAKLRSPEKSSVQEETRKPIAEENSQSERSLQQILVEESVEERTSSKPRKRGRARKSPMENSRNLSPECPTSQEEDELIEPTGLAKLKKMSHPRKKRMSEVDDPTPKYSSSHEEDIVDSIGTKIFEKLRGRGRGRGRGRPSKNVQKRSLGSSSSRNREPADEENALGKSELPAGKKMVEDFGRKTFEKPAGRVRKNAPSSREEIDRNKIGSISRLPEESSRESVEERIHSMSLAKLKGKGRICKSSAVDLKTRSLDKNSESREESYRERTENPCREPEVINEAKSPVVLKRRGRPRKSLGVSAKTPLPESPSSQESDRDATENPSREPLELKKKRRPRRSSAVGTKTAYLETTSPQEESDGNTTENSSEEPEVLFQKNTDEEAEPEISVELKKKRRPRKSSAVGTKTPPTVTPSSQEESDRETTENSSEEPEVPPQKIIDEEAEPKSSVELKKKISPRKSSAANIKTPPTETSSSPGESDEDTTKYAFREPEEKSSQKSIDDHIEAKSSGELKKKRPRKSPADTKMPSPETALSESDRETMENSFEEPPQKITDEETEPKSPAKLKKKGRKNTAAKKTPSNVPAPQEEGHRDGSENASCDTDFSPPESSPSTITVDKKMLTKNSVKVEKKNQARTSQGLNSRESSPNDLKSPEESRPETTVAKSPKNPASLPKLAKDKIPTKTSTTSKKRAHVCSLEVDDDFSSESATENTVPEVANPPLESWPLRPQNSSEKSSAKNTSQGFAELSPRNTKLIVDGKSLPKPKKRVRFGEASIRRTASLRPSDSSQETVVEEPSSKKHHRLSPNSSLTEANFSKDDERSNNLSDTVRNSSEAIQFRSSTLKDQTEITTNASERKLDLSNGLRENKKFKFNFSDNVSPDLSSLQRIPRKLEAVKIPKTREKTHRDEKISATAPMETSDAPTENPRDIEAARSSRWSRECLRLRRPIVVLKRLSRDSLRSHGYAFRSKGKKFVKNLKKPPVEDFRLPAYDGAADLTSDSEDEADLTIASDEKRVCVYQSGKKPAAPRRETIATPKKRRLDEPDDDSAGPSSKRRATPKKSSNRSPSRTSMLKSPGRLSGYYSPLKIIVTSPKVRKETPDSRETHRPESRDANAPSCGSVTPGRKRDRLHESMMRGRISATKSSTMELGERQELPATVASERSGELDGIASVGHEERWSVETTISNEPAEATRIRDATAIPRDSRDVRKRLVFRSTRSGGPMSEEPNEESREFNLSSERGRDFATIDEAEEQIELRADLAAGRSTMPVAERGLSGWASKFDDRDPYDVTTDEESAEEDDAFDVRLSQYVDDRAKENRGLADRSEGGTDSNYVRLNFDLASSRGVVKTMETRCTPKHRCKEAMELSDNLGDPESKISIAEPGPSRSAPKFDDRDSCDVANEEDTAIDEEAFDVTFSQYIDSRMSEKRAFPDQSAADAESNDEPVVGGLKFDPPRSLSVLEAMETRCSAEHRDKELFELSDNLGGPESRISIAEPGPSRSAPKLDDRDSCDVANDEDTANDEFNVTFSQYIDSRMSENRALLDRSRVDLKSNDERVVVRPKCDPPSRRSVVETMETHGIPRHRNQEPFFSVDADVPKQKELAHRMLKVPGKSLKDVPAFVSSVDGVTGIARWRKMKIAEFIPSLTRSNDVEVKIALCSNDKVVLTPLARPPTRKEAKDWLRAREYLKKKKHEEDESRKKKLEEEKIAKRAAEAEDECSSNASDLSPAEPSPENTGGKGEQDRALSRGLKVRLAKRELLRKVEEATGRKTRHGSEEEIEVDSQRAGGSRKGSGDSNSTEMDPSLLSVLGKSRLFREQEASRHLGVSCGQIEFLSDSTRSNVDNENLQNAKALTRYQYLTIMCLEVHVTTRGDLLPDAQYDSIAAIFYSVQSDVPPTSKIKPLEHGVIVVAETEKTKNKMYYSYASKFPWSISFAHNEEALLNSLVNLITRVDPEILIGWELETLSWGYVFQRASILGMNLYKRISRIPATQGKWEAQPRDIETLAEVKLPGRIVLDIWRIMRHEAALLSYTFESMMHHVLNERISCPSFKTLTEWWNLERPRPSRWRVVEHYSIRVLGVFRILDQLDIIGRTSELARLFGIQFFEVFSRGSQYRVESVMLRLAKPLNYIAVSPSAQQRASMRAMEALPLIMEPESMFYSDPLIVLDFQSLYPSIIIAHNYCFSTCLGRIEHIGQPEPFEFGAYTLRVPKSTSLKLQGKVNFAPCGVAFVKSEVCLGVLPRMLTEILETRFMVKKAMKDHKQDDKTLQRALHSRQMGLKFLANVTYGYTAANFSGRMPCIEVGDSVVSKSKETLERAIKLVESTPKWGARVVYGDTDSLFILVPGKSKADAFVIGNEIADAVTAANPPPIKLKFEKVVYPGILQTKKRYCGYMYETPQQETPTYLAKGIETVRRDGCPAVSKILEKTLKILFETKDVSLVKKYVTRQLDKVLRGKVSIQDLTFAKEFRGLKGYKAKACVPALELTKRLMKKDPRAVPRNSERVRYVIVAGAPNQALIHCVRTPWELINDPGLRPNGIYYVTRVIIPPLNRCLNLMGVDVNAWYREMPHRHILDNPVGQPGDRQKLTIFQYFGTIVCAVCGQSSNKGICAECVANPPDALVVLHDKLRRLDRTDSHVTAICQSCVGQADVADCASLDCPVLYRRAQAQRELTQVTHLRTIIECGNKLEL